MALRFSLFELLLIIGITHGTVIIALIVFARKKTADRLLLAALLTVFNLLCVRILLLTSGIWQVPVIRYLPLPFELSMQPLMYWYIRSVTQSARPLTRKDALHLIPFFLSFAYSLFIYLRVLPEPQLAVKDQLANDYGFDAVKETEDFLAILSAITYGLASYRLVTRYRRWLSQQTSNTGYPSYAWLRLLLILFGLLFTLMLLNLLLDLGGYGADHFIHWQVLFVYIAILIYYLGFRGYQTHPPALRPSEPAPVKTPERSTPSAEPSAEALTEVRDRILAALEKERWYLDQELSLATLSGKLGLPAATVSAAINVGLHKNFRQLINAYRVEAVKSRLTAPDARNWSLLGLAYECGFNSEASFYRIFKQNTGVSPKEYAQNPF